MKKLWEKLPRKIKVFITDRESPKIRHFINEASGYDVGNLGNGKDIKKLINTELKKRSAYILGGRSKDFEGRL